MQISAARLSWCLHTLRAQPPRASVSRPSGSMAADESAADALSVSVEESKEVEAALELAMSELDEMTLESATGDDAEDVAIATALDTYGACFEMSASSRRPGLRAKRV